MRQVPAKDGLSVGSIVFSIPSFPRASIQQPQTFLVSSLPILAGGSHATDRRHHYRPQS